MSADGLIFNASKKKVDDSGNPLVRVQEEELDYGDRPLGRQVKTFHFPEKKIQEMREMYDVVVVRDFGDDYHMSNEEKEKRFDLYDLFKPVASHKTKYRNIKQYVKAMRECYQFVVAMANKNKLIMPPEEFIAGVFSGDIHIDCFSFPKYGGNDRKDINWKFVRKYIVDPELDLDELSPKNEVNYIPVEVLNNPEEHLKEFFDEEQIQFIFHDYEHSSISMSYDPDVDGDRLGTVLPVSRKGMKKLMKNAPDLIRPIKNNAKRNVVDGVLRDFAFELDQSAYEYITSLDEKRGFIASDKMPKFTGDITNSDDVNRYLYQLEEFEEAYSRINHKGSIITMAEYKDMVLKDELDAAGWNIMEIYSNKKEQKKKERENRRDKKKEKRLRKKLTRLKNRRKKRDPDSNKVNSKKDKGKKRNKKKNKSMGKVLTSASGYKDKDFDEYESMMLDMSYGFKGDD